MSGCGCTCSYCVSCSNKRVVHDYIVFTDKAKNKDKTLKVTQVYHPVSTEGTKKIIHTSGYIKTDKARKPDKSVFNNKLNDILQKEKGLYTKKQAD